MYAPRGLDFDGSSDYLTRGGDLTGSADGKLGIFSAWIRLDGGDGALQYIFQSLSNFFFIGRPASNKFQVDGRNAANAAIFRHLTASTYTASVAWIHVLMSWDLADTSHIYIDDADDADATVAFTNDDIEYTKTNHAVGATTAGGGKFHGVVSDLYFTNEYLDFSSEANRRKFISADLKPVFLGTDGSLPTGTAPLVYMDFQTTGTNKGSGGNFSATGSPNIINGPVSPKIKSAAIASVLRK